MRRLLAFNRDRWKPVPSLFVNLMELTVKTSLKVLWNWKQILPLDRNKTK